MIDIHSKKDIEQISLDLLKQSKALDVFPTPVDQIVKCSDLVVAHEVDLSHVKDNFFSRATNNVSTLMKKVRGFLDRKEKTIYLDLSQSPSRKNFVKLHETGHDILPWQREIMEFMDDDSTLDPMTDEEFEIEANYFASTTLFQLDRFDSQISQLPLGLETVKHLSQKFGASIHSTFRRYVERSNKRCSLLVLKNLTYKGFDVTCEVRNYFQSKTFTSDFGTILWENDIDDSFRFVQEYGNGRRYHLDGEISLNTPSGNVDFNYHFFNSTYNAFIFFFPKGEKIKSRTKFILN